MSAKNIPVTDELEQYVRRVSLREPDILAKLREETAPLPNASMQSMPEQCQFMAQLVHLIGAKRTIEVGVFTGYSALWTASALPEDGKIVACDVSEEWTSIARRYWKQAGVEHKIELRLGPAIQTLDLLLREGGRGSFDFAYIDADKENYAKYYERIFELLRPRGLILVDNVLWSGRVIDDSAQDKDTRALRAFNLSVSQDDRVWLTLLPFGDGLTMLSKK